MNIDSKKPYQKWLLKVEEDFTLIKHEMSFKEEEIVTSLVCYHCQQGVEKLLKAFLIYNNLDFKPTHNLEYLLELCKNIDKDFSPIDLGNLTDYAISARYPVNFIVPSFTETKIAVDIAMKIREFILNKIK